MRRKIDTILLAVALFCISGVVLAYNITTADGEIAVSLSELAEFSSDGGGLMSVYSANVINNLTNESHESEVAVNAPVNEGMNRSYELLDPIVKAPS